MPPGAPRRVDVLSRARRAGDDTVPACQPNRGPAQLISVTTTTRSTSWEADSACLGAEPNLFFPLRTDASVMVSAAKRVCARCRVSRQCLDEAVRRGHSGIWGGTTPEERRVLQRR